MRPPIAVITAGGTREPVDDVRVLTNLSTGRFGAALANALVARGVRVVLLASRELARRDDLLDARVEVVPFGSFVELRAGLDRAVATPPDLLFMAAAVSDYSPVPASGKLSSKAETRTLELVRNPKLLSTLRTTCGPDTFLVGFKLLSGVSPDRLLDVARRQVVDNDLDLCLANDLAELQAGAHPAWFVAATGAPVRTEGDKAHTAAALADHSLRASGTRTAPHALDADRLRALVPALQEVFELDAWPLAPLDVRPGVGDRAVGVHGQLASRAPSRWSGGAVTVPGPPGRAWVAGPPGTRAALEGQLARLRAGLPCPADVAAHPVLDAAAEVVGLVTPEVQGVRVWIAPEARRRGHGDTLALALDAATQPVRVDADDATLAWWIERGWQPVAPGVLGPPSGRSDHRPAASMCLVDPVAERVLVGQRLVPPWPGWWAFPGGSVDPGESLLQAARRELAEETGIVCDLPPVASRVIHVSSGAGERCYAVTNFEVPVLAQADPVRSSELDARWVSLDEALALRPMAAGTRRVLRLLHARRAVAHRPPR